MEVRLKMSIQGTAASPSTSLASCRPLLSMGARNISSKSADPSTICAAVDPYERERYMAVVPPRVRIVGHRRRWPKCSIARTTSTMTLRGRAIVISFLHCGQRTRFFRPALEREDGASMSATQSKMQLSWATSAQGHGERHRDVVGVSSVSSAKQIQQRFMSFRSTGLGRCEV